MTFSRRKNVSQIYLAFLKISFNFVNISKTGEQNLKSKSIIISSQADLIYIGLLLNN